MTLENGWLKRAYTTHTCKNAGTQISEHKAQIIKTQLATYELNYADRTREHSFFSDAETAVREEA